MLDGVFSSASGEDWYKADTVYWSTVMHALCRVMNNIATCSSTSIVPQGNAYNHPGSSSI